MEFEFDKEIDAILRKARDAGAVFAVENSQSQHLDADEISAFAENALPDATRKQYTAHLAECSRCRKILSNLISLNSEIEKQAENQAAFSTFPAGAKAESAPWYRRLFAFPQLAYAMGAMVLLFGGFLAFIVLQNSSKDTASIAKQENYEEKIKGGSGASSDGETSSSYLANTAVNTANTFANAAANVAVGNSNAATFATPAAPSLNTNSTAANTPVASAPQKPQTQPKSDAKDTVADKREAEVQPENKGGETLPMPNAAIQPPKPSATPLPETTEVAKEKPAENLRQGIAEDTQSDALKPRDMPTTLSARKSRSAETRSVGGKTFRRVDSAWVDSEYNRDSSPQGNFYLPALTNVSRGSEAYKKLDSGLRNIAEKLGGVVIIVWNGKGYRIQ